MRPVLVGAPFPGRRAAWARRQWWVLARRVQRSAHGLRWPFEAFGWASWAGWDVPEDWKTLS